MAVCDIRGAFIQPVGVKSAVSVQPAFLSRPWDLRSDLSVCRLLGTGFHGLCSTWHTLLGSRVRVLLSRVSQAPRTGSLECPPWTCFALRHRGAAVVSRHLRCTAGALVSFRTAFDSAPAEAGFSCAVCRQVLQERQTASVH